ncbi:MAG: 1-acyl-sn-glycerol-3-phosphate acyltransferase [Chloroflexi bacterium]|nr:1-acyl-sn-glycerol-3-phosphate acyltransferase [Chloroflexota bacterium]
MRSFFWACNTGFKVSLKVWADYKATGTENVPTSGPLIIIANHQSNMDPPVIARTISRKVFFPAKRELFDLKLAALFLYYWGSFPLARGRADSSAYRQILGILGQPDGALTLFPEGTRTRGSMREAQRGPATIAMRTGVSVLPIGITGTHSLGNVFRALSPSATIRVNIGKPFKVVDAGLDRKDAIEGATKEAMGRVAELLPESYRGFYADAVGRDRQFTQDLPANAR